MLGERSNGSTTSSAALHKTGTQQSGTPATVVTQGTGTCANVAIATAGNSVAIAGIDVTTTGAQSLQAMSQAQCQGDTGN